MPRRDLTGLIDQGIVSAGTLLTTATFIRGAGLEEFGVLSLVWLVLLFATALQHAVVIAPAHSMLPKLEPSVAAGFRGWLVLVQAAAVALLALVLVVSWLVPGFSLLPREPGLVPALAFLISRQALSFLRLQLFTERDGPRQAVVVDALHSVGAVGALVWLAGNETLTTRSGLWALTAAASLAALVALPHFVRQGCRLRLPERELLSRYWGLAKWLAGKAVAQWFTANSFLAALGTLQGPAALGGVRAAQTLIGVAGVMIQAFENLVPAQAAAALREGGPERLRSFLAASIRRWYVQLVLGLLPIVVFPDFFLRLLTGREEPGLREPLYFFAVGSGIALAVLLLQVALRSVERVGAVFWAQLAAGALGAVAAVPVTKAFGIRGCMVGILVQQVVVFALLVGPARRRLREGEADGGGRSGADRS